MTQSRREFLRQSALATGAAVVGGAMTLSPEVAQAAEGQLLRIDTHQHLWDLSKQKMAWLTGAPAILKHNYRSEEYAAATAGRLMRTVYMEIDIEEPQLDAEAELVIGLCQNPKHPMVAAVIGGRPASKDFEGYIKKHAASGHVKGVRQVLHGEPTPKGYCLQPEFVKSIQLLGKMDLNFDLCMRPGELLDALQLTEKCPDTRFVLDHCGNANVTAFVPGESKPVHDPEAWKRDIEALAKRPNVFCKISGIIATAKPGWTAATLAPVVNHCLDSFGPDRVVFGGDWPVCLLGAPLNDWISALTTIIEKRPAADREKLWSGNAKHVYRLPTDLKLA